MSQEKVLLGFRDATVVQEALDAWAERQRLGRSEVLRVLVREGLERRGMWPLAANEKRQEGRADGKA